MNDPQSESICISATGAEPLQLAEAKTWLKVDFDDDDSLITGLCTAARQFSEKFCRRSFLTGEQWQLNLDRFPGSFLGEAGFFSGFPIEYTFPELFLLRRPTALAIELPEGPVTAVNTVAYTDPTGAVQTLAPSAYTFVPDGDGTARLYPALQPGVGSGPAYVTRWPSTMNYPQSVQILYTTGAVPDAAVVVAMKQIVAHWYANRESVVMVPGVTPQNVPMAAQMLLWPYRNFEFV